MGGFTLIFPKELIRNILKGIEFAEEETLSDYDLHNIKQEDPITSRLATRIQDETNKVIRSSKYNDVWRCDVIELTNKGRNSLEKTYGFDMGITIKDQEKNFIKSIVIQNKMVDGNSANIQDQINRMLPLSPKSPVYVGIIDIAGIYLATDAILQERKYDFNNIDTEDLIRFPNLIEEFLKCHVGQRGLDLQKLYYFPVAPTETKKDMVVVSFEKTHPS